MRVLSVGAVAACVLNLCVAGALAKSVRTGTRVVTLRWTPLAGVHLRCEVVDFAEGGEHQGARLTVFGPVGQKLFSYDGDAFRSAVPLLIPPTPTNPTAEELLLVEWSDGQSWELLVLRAGGTGVAVVADYFFRVEHYLLLNLNDDEVPAIVTWDWVPDQKLPTSEWPIVGTVHRWVQGSFIESGKVRDTDVTSCIAGHMSVARPVRP
jgi:hypothetical protein